MAYVTITNGLSTSAALSVVANGGIVVEGDANLEMTGGLIVEETTELAGEATLGGEFSVLGKGQLEYDCITTKEVIDEILLLWGIESPSLAKEVVQNQAINEINAAMQLINSQAKELDYLTRVARTYNVSTHTESITLEADVQNVEGAVKWIRPGVIIHKESTTSPYVWHIDFSGVYGGNAGISLAAGGQTATATVHILDSSGKKAWPLNQSGESLNDTGRTDFKIDIPALLATFEAASTISPGDVMITGSWPYYKVEFTTDESGVSLTASTSGLIWDQPSLRPLASRSQLDNYRNLFGSYSAGMPEYYYVDRSRTGDAENTSVKLELRPPIDLGSGVDPGEISVDVSVEPPHFNWDDYAKSTPIPLPHKYVESLFLPIVRYRATVSHYYVGTQGAEALQANYQAALVQYGMVDPQIKEAEEVEQK